VPQTYTARFDALTARGRAAVLGGSARFERPPADGEQRWGTSVLLRPDEESAARIGQLTAEAMAVAGPRHWPTGTADSSHFTLCAVEDHRDPVPTEDAPAARWLTALHTAAAGLGPVALQLTGVALSPGGVLLRTEPHEDTMDRLYRAYRKELGPAAWYETGPGRDIWHATLVHFREPPRQPQALVDWVAERRELDLGRAVAARVELAVWRYDGWRMLPRVLGAVPLAGN
jgi:hypothetical protein